ncbi:hypothetical protein ACTJJE_11245 [Mycolicibacterium sp. 22603]|uniref:hypothetical protein n=1 Tax=Mycolicibacterium sp. 22603 TaxID=3453950 RepID=UPI003F8724EA
MTTEFATLLADASDPGRVIGLVIGRLLILGLIIWGIVHLIRKRRRRGQLARSPQPYWDGSAWRQPQQGQQPQPYWDGQAWQYPQPQYPQHPGSPWPQGLPPYPPTGPGSGH